MLLKRYLAGFIDFVITEIVVSCIVFWIKPLSENIIKYNYIFMILFIAIGLFINYIIIKLTKGFTLGEKILNINIYSTKFSGNKFYIIRIVFKIITMYFMKIFIPISIIVWIVTKKDILWYDKFLGIKYNE